MYTLCCNWLEEILLDSIIIIVDNIYSILLVIVLNIKLHYGF